MSGRVERRHPASASPGNPSGFCLLFDRALAEPVRGYLAEFDRYRQGELDAHAAWRHAKVRCLVARDTFVFHARGGSGGYYRYDRGRAL